MKAQLSSCTDRLIALMYVPNLHCVRFVCSNLSKVEPPQLTPTEIGHAAAYEAYRIWVNNSSAREPLVGDIGKQREGLIGLAIAEGKMKP